MPSLRHPPSSLPPVSNQYKISSLLHPEYFPNSPNSVCPASHCYSKFQARNILFIDVLSFYLKGPNRCLTLSPHGKTTAPTSTFLLWFFSLARMPSPPFLPEALLLSMGKYLSFYKTNSFSKKLPCLSLSR